MTSPQQNRPHNPAKASERVEALRQHIGARVPLHAPWNEYASVDAFRHFAHGVGDDNPLHCDPTYGAKTRWSSVIAPPTFVATMGVPEPAHVPREMKGTLAGLLGAYTGDEWEWFRPVCPGDRLTSGATLHSVEEKPSQFAGTAVIVKRRYVYVNQRDEPVATWTMQSTHLEAHAARERKKYAPIVRPVYTPEQLKEIEAAYDAEKRRGGEPRYWEDVQVGEQLTPIVRGPLLVTDMIAFLAGFGGHNVQAHRLRLAHQRRNPRRFAPNEFGVPDITDRNHWDDVWAQRTGNPYAFDFGWQRIGWICTQVQNWMGDDAWLWKLTDQYRLFNYIGDTTWVEGMVVGKSEVEGRRVVELDVWCKNQRGAITAPAHATVILPSREAGLPPLPEPPRKAP
ncbi:MAG: MaoC family dehydratase N-terminal domain-containing protein [Dehalococcoidia bacterium]|nr:MaoC family dehydratase N-terminal domain-containing protein [Dehalococcoidia bacterium]